jgi:hypothetical protein
MNSPIRRLRPRFSGSDHSNFKAGRKSEKARAANTGLRVGEDGNLNIEKPAA